MRALGNEPKSKVAKFSAEKLNKNSVSSRSLSTLSPLAVWASELNMDDLEQATRATVSITHSNMVV